MFLSARLKSDRRMIELTGVCRKGSEKMGEQNETKMIERSFCDPKNTEIERTYKDTVFVTVFQEKDKLIELYNAIFDADYDTDTEIDIVTIQDVLFRTLKNDVAFILGGRFVVLVEHQSTLNGNMPLRDLLYIATVLKRMVDSKQLYREKTVMIPRPAFIVLYNGQKDAPEYQELRLSDAYLGEKRPGEEEALQLVIKMYNIHSSKNAEILKKCETLRQYSRFVEIMRSYQHIDQLTNAAMVKIMEQCRQEGVLTDFLEKYGTEIVEMLFKELTREEDLEISRLDGYDAGLKEGEKSGIARGAAQEKREIAKKFKESGIPLDVIAKNTGLTPEEVAEL